MRAIWEGTSSVHGGAEEWRFQLRSTKQNPENGGRPAWIWRGLIGVWIGGDLISAADDQVNNYSVCWNGEVALGAANSGVYGENAGHGTCYMTARASCTSGFCDILVHIIPLNAAVYGAEHFCFFFVVFEKSTKSFCCGAGSAGAWTKGLDLMWVPHDRGSAEFSSYEGVLTSLTSALIPHMAVTLGGKRGEEAALVRQCLGSEGEWRQKESKEDICPLGALIRFSSVLFPGKVLKLTTKYMLMPSTNLSTCLRFLRSHDRKMSFCFHTPCRSSVILSVYTAS